MLLNDFYTIKEISTKENNTAATISLNAQHAIFEGHFPGNPIVPGVTMLQIVKEILGEALGCKLFLAKTRNAKFTAILNPVDTPEVEININSSLLEAENGWKGTGTISKDDTTFFKFTAHFTQL